MIDEMNSFVLFAALLLPVGCLPLVIRQWPKVGLSLLALYVIIYIPLTVSGKYVVANHGGADWQREWLPKALMVDYRGFSGRTKAGLTLAGALYWPCILLDRFLWHRTEEILY